MAGLTVDIYVCVGITYTTAFLALIGRVAARRITKVRWWWDDYLCVAAMLFATGYEVSMLYWTVEYMLGQYIPDDYTDAQKVHIMRESRFLQFLISLNYSYSIAASKASILLFYWRIFKHSSIRIPIQVLLGITGIWLILRTFMVIFKCVPVQAYWDYDIKGARCDINDSQFFFGTCLTHFLMDVIILVLPVIEVFKLRLRFGQKLGITALFVLGIIVCLASLFVIIESIRYDSNTRQMPHDMALNNLWGSVEVTMAVVSGCFPLLRPIFSYILPASFLSSAGNSSHPISRGTQGIRLTTLTRTHKEKDADETSSTYQLADPEQGMPSTPEFDQHGKDAGISTIITSELQHPRQPGDQSIHVRNDMVVQVEKLDQRTYAMKR